MNPIFQAEVLEACRKRMEFINSQRSEIIEAFLAKHGCQPDDCVQVIQRDKDGTEKFIIRLQTPEEKALFSK